jgi:hypothetical protein
MSSSSTANPVAVLKTLAGDWQVRQICKRFLIIVRGAFLGTALATPCWRYVQSFALLVPLHDSKYCNRCMKPQQPFIQQSLNQRDLPFGY